MALGQRKPRGKFPTRPGRYAKEAFLEHIRATGQPETFSGIDSSEIHCLDDVEIILEFFVDRKKRPNLDEVPCPLCSPNAPKFLRGYLIWSPSKQNLQVIGRECGSQIDDDWNKRQRALKKRQKDEAREEFLENNWHLVPALVRSFRERGQLVLAQRKAWVDFRKGSPAITQLLRHEMKTGALTVAKITGSNSVGALRASQGASKFQTERIGPVVGQTAVKSDFNHHKKTDQQIQALEMIDFGDDPNETFYKLCDTSTQDAEVVEKTIKKSQRELKGLGA